FQLLGVGGRIGLFVHHLVERLALGIELGLVGLLALNAGLLLALNDVAIRIHHAGLALQVTAGAIAVGRRIRVGIGVLRPRLVEDEDGRQGHRADAKLFVD